MKVRVWSDIHTEFGRLDVTKTDDDKDVVLIIAGDFMVWSAPDRDELLDDVLAGLCEQFKAVIYCCGNHEFYGSCYQDVIDGFAMFADSHDNFYFLDGGAVPIIDGVRFVGGTFWTDFRNGDEAIMANAAYRMNDYRQTKIRVDGVEQKMTPQFTRGLNTACRKHIMEVLSKPFDGKNVVITHHLPCYLRAAEYVDDRLEYAYGNTNLNEIFELPIHTWIHGHVHVRQVYEVGEEPNPIRVIANPRGYRGYQAIAYTFEDAKVWDI